MGRNNLDKVFSGLVIALKRNRRARKIVSQRKATRRSTLQSDVLNYLHVWSAHQRELRNKTEQSLQQREDAFLTVELSAKESIVLGVAGENEFDDTALKSVQRVHATVAARTPHKTEAQVVRSSRPASQSEKSGTSLRKMAKCIPLETSQV